VLIDGRSGSATEAYAAAIKESGTATLFGQQTAGAMLSSTKVNVPGGWTLLLPEADFITTGGMRVEGKGVEPHIVVLPEKSEDTILKKAVEFLKTN
jgi:carboxyl-terminal processing protease